MKAGVFYFLTSNMMIFMGIVDSCSIYFAPKSLGFTDFDVLFAHSSLVVRLIEWIHLSRWICAFHEAPASLLFGDDALVKWIVTKSCV